MVGWSGSGGQRAEEGEGGVYVRMSGREVKRQVRTKLKLKLALFGVVASLAAKIHSHFRFTRSRQLHRADL